MKKAFLTTVLAISIITAFCQSKASKTDSTQHIQPAATNDLILKKEQAVEMYKLLEYCKEATANTISKKITVAEANSVLAGIESFQKMIADKYQPKQALSQATDKK